MRVGFEFHGSCWISQLHSIAAEADAGGSCRSFPPMMKAGTRTSLTRRVIPQIGTISCTAWSGKSRIQQTLITNRLRHLHRSHLLLRLRNLLGVSHGARGKDLSLNSLGSKVVSNAGVAWGGARRFKPFFDHSFTNWKEQSKGVLKTWTKETEESQSTHHLRCQRLRSR